jgi:hypothetical protein
MGALDFDVSPFVNKPALAANSAKFADPGGELAALATLAGVPAIPLYVRDGLSGLSARAPSGIPPKRWSAIGADAKRIGLESLEAEKALALGWDAMDLFGWSPSGEGWESLSVWARGRRCYVARVIEGGRAIDLAFTREPGRFAWWYRRSSPADTRTLWDV